VQPRSAAATAAAGAAAAMSVPTGGDEVPEGGVWLQEAEAQQVRHLQAHNRHRALQIRE